MAILKREHIKMFIIFFLLLFFVVIFSSWNRQRNDEAKYFSNPILVSGADPFVYQHTDGFYYCMVTRGSRLTIWKAKSFTNLSEAETKDVWFPPAAGPNSSSIWAPEIHFIRGAWYIYYTACDKKNQGDQSRCVFVLRNTSENPLTGSWEDLGKIDMEYPGIDGDVFEYKGDYYFLYSPYVKNQRGMIITGLECFQQKKMQTFLILCPGQDLIHRYLDNVRKIVSLDRA